MLSVLSYTEIRTTGTRDLNNYNLQYGGVAVSWFSNFAQIFCITDVIMVVVALVAIGIGVWLAFQWSNLDCGGLDLNYLESSDSGCPFSEPDAPVDAEPM